MNDYVKMDLNELAKCIEISLDDFEDLEIFCFCTGTCVALRCGVN